MERLDDDLTSYILKTSYHDMNGSLLNYDYFYDRLPKTMTQYINDSDYLNSINKVITPYIKININKLIDKVIELHHNIIKKGWQYSDLKMDNICYKIINSEIQLYFIDKESGLLCLNNNKPKFTDYLNIFGLIIPIFDYGILGQYNFSNIFNIQFQDKQTQDEEFYNNLMKCKKLIEQYKYTILNLNKNYQSRDLFKWIPFKKILINTEFEDYSDFYVIQFVVGKFRLIYFDENGYHMSTPNFNKTKLYIDNLYDNLDDIFILIKNI
jgi:hypothetical protein